MLIMATAGEYVHTIKYFVYPDKLAEFYTHLNRTIETLDSLPECLRTEIRESAMVPGNVEVEEVWAVDEDEMVKIMREKVDSGKYFRAIKPLMQKEWIENFGVRKMGFSRA